MANISKDDRIIKANPGATPHELRVAGLSEAKVQELIEKENMAIKAKPQQVIPQKETQEPKAKVKPDIQKTDVHRATPFLKQPAIPKSDTVNVVERSTGKATPMTRHFAERFIKKNAKTHVIR